MLNEQNSSEVRERILLTAKELFIKNGYNGTSVRDIAAASGTNVAMVSYYFRSKYNLFELIFEEALNALILRLSSTISSDKPFLELIKEWINTYFDILFEYPQIPLFILNEVSQNPQRLTARIKEYNPYSVYEVVAQKVEEEVAAGNIVPTHPAHLLLNILSLCMYPFMFGTLATAIMGISLEMYHELIKDHKAYVVEFTINALKPKA